MTGRLTTHVLDTSIGLPAAGIQIRLIRLGATPVLVCETITNADGRTDHPLLETARMLAGTYELLFTVGAYFARINPNLPTPPFLDDIVLRFGIAAPDQHIHVPLLVSPYGYSTYRGS